MIRREGVPPFPAVVVVLGIAKEVKKPITTKAHTSKYACWAPGHRRTNSLAACYIAGDRRGHERENNCDSTSAGSQQCGLWADY
jgi:hypothetical protein